MGIQSRIVFIILLGRLPLNEDEAIINLTKSIMHTVLNILYKISAKVDLEMLFRFRGK